jgi:hypothetical protein
MTIWLILLNRLRKHAMLHLIIPLAIGLMVESVGEGLITGHGDKIESWLPFLWHYLFSTRTMLLVAGVFFSYIGVMYILIGRETKVRVDERDLAGLQKTLNDAESYFGLSVMHLEEWFDPSMQVYLAKLVNRKLARCHLQPQPDFEHERTLLFFSNSESKRATVLLTDENHFGRCLARLHKDCDIPLSYLDRKEIFDILKDFTDEEREALGCYPRWTNWPLGRAARRIPLRWLRRRIKQLDCAVVRKKGGEVCVLRVSKHGAEVRIREQFTGPRAEPYTKLLELIRKKIYPNGTKDLDNNHDFISIYYP